MRTQEEGIIQEVQDILADYNSSIEITAGLFFSQKQTIRAIEYATNSKYLSGDKDELGRDKPYYNIVNFRVNIAVRATDFDVKDIQVMSDEPAHYEYSRIISKEVFLWMKESNYSRSLNQQGETRARYGGVVVKKNEKDGKLTVDVVQWRNICTDQTDFERGAVVEMHWLTPRELYEKMDVWDNDGITEAIEIAKKEAKAEGGTPMCLVYEVHGLFPKYLIDENAEGIEYCQQRHFIAAKDYEPFICLDGTEMTELPYKYLAWDEVSGRTLGRGVVEDGLEAQIWTNSAVIAEKQAMDLASKIVLKSNSEEINGNILTDVNNGEIINVGSGDLQPLNLTPAALGNMQNLIEKWHVQYERASSTFNAISGETMPSGTPFRAVAVQSANSASIFDYRREQMGIFQREIFNDWVLPYVMKKISKKHILNSTFTVEELQRIDAAFVRSKKIKRIKEILFNEKRAVTLEDLQTLEQSSLELIGRTADRRFLEIPENIFKEVKPYITIVTTGEQRNKAAVLQSLSEIMATVGSNPTILQDPTLRKIFSQMVELSGAGISPAELIPSNVAPQQPVQSAISAPQLDETTRSLAQAQQ